MKTANTSKDKTTKIQCAGTIYCVYWRWTPREGIGMKRVETERAEFTVEAGDGTHMKKYGQKDGDQVGSFLCKIRKKQTKMVTRNRY